MKSGLIFAILMGVFLLNMTACRSVSQPTPVITEVSQEKSAPNMKEIIKQAWEVKWEKVVEGARKEGVVVVFGSASGEIGRSLAKPLWEKFGLRLEYLSGGGGELAQKLSSERRAGLYLADIYMGGNTTMMMSLKPAGYFSPLEPEIILPEVLDTKLWYGGKLRFVDKDNLILSFIVYANDTITINTDLVRPGEIKSYKDLLEPRWKGKIIMDYPAAAGLGQKFVHMVGKYILNYDFLGELAKQEPILLRDKRLPVQWLAQGKYPIALVAYTDVVSEFKKSGAPIDDLTPLEGTWTTSGHGNIAVMNKPAHPDAARVFINWTLTKEGQSVYTKAYGASSRRLDVSTEGLDQDMLIRPGVRYVEGDSEQVALESPQQVDIAKQIFGHLMK